MTRSQRHLVEVTGYCSRDSDISQGGWSPCTQQPVIDGIDPTEAYVGDTDVDVHIYGYGFQPTSVVVVLVGIRSNLVSKNEMIVTLSPARVSEPLVVPIYVQNGPYSSNVVNFNLVSYPPP